MSTLIWSGTSTWNPEPDVLQTPEDGWDTITRHLAVYAASQAIAQATVAKGDAHPDFAQMFCVDITAKPLICGSSWWDVMVVYRGIAEDKPAKYLLNSQSNRQSYEAIVGLPSTIGAVPADVSQSRPSLTVRYLQDGQPDMTVVSTNEPLPISVAVPDNVFTSTTNAVLAYPYGWVLDARSADNIPGTTLWAVTDQFVHYQQWRPKN